MNEQTPPSDEVLLAQRSAEMDAELARGRRQGWVQVAFMLAVVVTVWAVTTQVPYGSAIFIASALAWTASAWWALIPGRCEVCQLRTPLRIPRALGWRRPRWWDIRPPRRSDNLFACPQHIGFVMLARMLGPEAAENYDRLMNDKP